ncbi:MAG TPA: MaoC family dehydratase N-terminal domain-containing protein [Dehalococcoidales bacterium]|nr:MaoC family dehydratase N-terminal domain-containing protein [Dehalococcoidales bacterium]
MAEGIEELKDRIGVEREVGVYQIEKAKITSFARAIGDPNPRWQDIAPPSLIPTLGFARILPELISLFPTLLHGSTELECHQPVRAGDRITVSSQLAKLRQRAGKDNRPVAFLTIELTYKNQRQELVARCRQVLIAQ